MDSWGAPHVGSGGQLEWEILRCKCERSASSEPVHAPIEALAGLLFGPKSAHDEMRQ
jgi:hypothetical protein